jgi:hypothetical protein
MLRKWTGVRFYKQFSVVTYSRSKIIYLVWLHYLHVEHAVADVTSYVTTVIYGCNKIACMQWN